MDKFYKETLRYMGHKTGEVPKALSDMIFRARGIIDKEISPKSVYKIYDISCDEKSVTVSGNRILSSFLARHLKDCEKAILFAATLGASADKIQRKEAIEDISRAAVFQAACAAAIEEYCDKATDKITEEFKAEGLYPMPRFSPGYGDFDIKYQELFLNALETGKRIGLFMTESFMLAPTKSVTAIIGLTPKPPNEEKNCSLCDNLNCTARRS